MKKIKDMSPEEAAYESYRTLIQYILRHKELHHRENDLYVVKFTRTLIEEWENGWKPFSEVEPELMEERIMGMENLMGIMGTTPSEDHGDAK